MGLLDLFSKSTGVGLVRLPSGCFTVDRSGQIISSTVPKTFPAERVDQIAQLAMAAFRMAQEAQLQFNEIQIHYPALKLTVRELRGGAMVFLAPRTSTQT
jgi:hypothetical protein